eukprot:scaffold8602_cov196-Amphora_coffeaeformis.AAC.15
MTTRDKSSFRPLSLSNGRVALNGGALAQTVSCGKERKTSKRGALPHCVRLRHGVRALFAT